MLHFHEEQWKKVIGKFLVDLEVYAITILQIESIKKPTQRPLILLHVAKLFKLFKLFIM